MYIRIERGSSAPISRQIAEQIRAQCLAGVLKPGRCLPSVRQLASEIAVNVNTIVRVYERLAAEGLVELRHGDGRSIRSIAFAFEHGQAQGAFGPPHGRGARDHTLLPEIEAQEARGRKQSPSPIRGLVILRANGGRSSGPSAPSDAYPKEPTRSSFPPSCARRRRTCYPRARRASSRTKGRG